MRHRGRGIWVILAFATAGAKQSGLFAYQDEAAMADYKTISVDIGTESSFTKLPAQVDIGDWSYFLAKSKKGVYQLLSNVCPHAMGEVVDWGNTFMCPDHGWLFEKSEGICINGPNSRMTAFPVNVEGGRLIATVPDD